ncbi:hypothetical protein HK099_006715 [Clydaea vesicula]|uniref:Uncharacterized protein n=1 Tax=Clydaea vesicula TaxID=447962 RepID=A0AAD5XZC1_9FUNG|nr:hypothetical protein HK099_006715 [Clydaea vesicula]
MPDLKLGSSELFNKKIKDFDSAEDLHNNYDDSLSIIPWISVKKCISSSLPKSLLPVIPVNVDATPKSRTLIVKKDTQTHAQSITLPHGFQLQKQIFNVSHDHTLSNIIFWDTAIVDTFSTLDSRNCSVIRGSTKVLNFLISNESQQQKADDKNNGCTGLNNWIYCSKWKCLIASTTHLELKILDCNMKVLTSTSSFKPVLSLEFANGCEELIAGCVNSIRIYRFKRLAVRGRYIQTFANTRLVIDDFGGDECWVTKTLLHEPTGKLYASVENHLYIFDFNTGEKLNCMKNIHVLSITSLLYCEGVQYLVTGSKDGCIKVWNNNGYLVHTLKDQLSITSLLHQPDISNKKSIKLLQLQQQQQNFILSSSLDGSVCLWDIDSGALLNKMESANECVGMGKLKKDFFFYFSKSSIYIYNITKAWQTFSTLRSSGIQITRCYNGSGAARLLVVAIDGSLRLISPLSGSILMTGLPVMEDFEPVTAVYNINFDKIWLLLKNGNVAMYDCSSNPMSISGQWLNLNNTGDKCTQLVLYEHTSTAMRTLKLMDTYTIFGATEAGQIVAFENDGKQHLLVQAHTAKISSLILDKKRNQLISSSCDNSIKIWSIKCQEVSHASHQPFILRLVLVIPLLDSPTRMALNNISDFSNLLAIVTDTYKTLMIKINSDNSYSTFKDHTNDENHIREVTCVAGNNVLNIFVTSSYDGTIKVWDGLENVLIREVQFNEIVWSVEFANPRGDIVAGVGDEIVLIKVQDYLPYHIQQYILNLEFEDDLLEMSLMFDPSLDFWDLYRKLLQEAGIEVENWHIDICENKKNSVSSNLLSKEELEKRIHVINQRRNKRLFLENERMHFETAKDFECTTKFSDNILELSDDHREKASCDLELEERQKRIDVYKARARRKLHDKRTITFKDLMMDDDVVQILNDSSQPSPELEENQQNSVGTKKKECEFKFIDERVSNRFLNGFKTDLTRKASIKFEQTSVSSTENDGVLKNTKIKSIPVTRKPLLAHAESFVFDINTVLPPIVASDADPNGFNYDMLDYKGGLILDKPAGLKMNGSEVQDLLNAENIRAQKLLQVSAKETQKKIVQKLMSTGSMPNSNRIKDVNEELLNSGERKRKSKLSEKFKGALKFDNQKEELNRPKTLSKALYERIQQKKRELALKETDEGHSYVEEDLTNFSTSFKDSMLKKETIDNNVVFSGPPFSVEKKLVELPVKNQDDQPDSPDMKEIENNDNNSEEGYVSDKSEPHVIKSKMVPVLKVSKKVAIKKRKRAPGTEYILTSSDSDTDSTLDSVESEEEIISNHSSEHNQVLGLAEKNLLLAQYREQERRKLEKIKKRNKESKVKEKLIKPMIKQVDKMEDGNLMKNTSSETKNAKSLEQTNFTNRNDNLDNSFNGADNRESLFFEKEEFSGNRSAARENLESLERSKNSLEVSCGKVGRSLPKEYLEAEKESWQFLKTIAVEKMKGLRQLTNETVFKEVYKEIEKKAWFPGLGDKEVNLENIVEVLFKVLDTGFWKEKIEASNAIHSIYCTFKEDFCNAESKILRPLIEHTMDDSPKVRANICCQIGKIAIYDECAIAALISRLKDKEKLVRESAKAALECFGIFGKLQLKETMMGLNILKSDKKFDTHSDWLDILLKKLKKKEREDIKFQNSACYGWRRNFTEYDFGSERPTTNQITLNFLPSLVANTSSKVIKKCSSEEDLSLPKIAKSYLAMKDSL